ncbi:hypothetical protein H696_05360 [Fonticula alba]|uniref:Uncharacterized protein n=1 Tax=Fonticula alba TaxID=691883 RepID=A0A058Z3L2_FONAL|nr:hypothetical protein H696_05360 [Fonticula alba]KCV68107.1 hypothetical protein H696_05360 [Fonticula alba]|eukprot:XP_009497481.1 hypothetical protein H696_05360 [Fonticula alba]
MLFSLTPGHQHDPFSGEPLREAVLADSDLRRLIDLRRTHPVVKRTLDVRAQREDLRAKRARFLEALRADPANPAAPSAPPPAPPPE